VSWLTVDQRAHEAFERGPGVAATAQRLALTRQGDQWASRWQAVTISHWGEVGALDGAAASGDQILSAAVTVALGDAQAAWRAALGAQAGEADAERSAARLAFIAQAQDAYLAWWVAEATHAHLTHFIDDARAELVPLRAATQRQTLSALDLYDMEAEVARLDTERAEMARAATEARADLQAHLSAPVALSMDGMPPLTEDAPADTLPNPWRALRADIDRHPALAALNRRAASLRAQAHASRASNPLTLTAGGGVRLDERYQAWGALTVGVTIPLAHPGEASAALYDGQAAAADADRAWAAARLHALLDAQALRFDALTDHQRALSDRWWPALTTRQAALEDALTRGLVERARVIRARRDLHECVHARLVLRAALTAHTARANALRRLLTEGDL
jgi:hypothetical protein